MHEQTTAEPSHVAFSRRKAEAENARDERERQRAAANDRSNCERFEAETKRSYEARMKAFARQ